MAQITDTFFFLAYSPKTGEICVFFQQKTKNKIVEKMPKQFFRIHNRLGWIALQCGQDNLCITLRFWKKIPKVGRGIISFSIRLSSFLVRKANWPLQNTGFSAARLSQTTNGRHAYNFETRFEAIVTDHHEVQSLTHLACTPQSGTQMDRKPEYWTSIVLSSTLPQQIKCPGNACAGRKMKLS